MKECIIAVLRLMQIGRASWQKYR